MSNTIQPKNTVSVVVQWSEGGKTQQRTLEIAAGTVVDSDNSGKFVAAKGSKTPIWNMEKGDAYVLLGASHASEKKGDSRYKLDKHDMKILKEEWENRVGTESSELKNNTAQRSGYGAGLIGSAIFNTRGEYVVTHGSSNSRISIFMK